jgi:hypothetical protein
MQKLILNNVFPLVLSLIGMFSSLLVSPFVRLDKIRKEIVDGWNYLAFTQAWILVPFSAFSSFVLADVLKKERFGVFIVVFVTLWVGGILVLFSLGEDGYRRKSGLLRTVGKIAVLCCAVAKIYIEYKWF